MAVATQRGMNRNDGDGYGALDGLRDRYELSNKLVATGWELWIASARMPEDVPRLAHKGERNIWTPEDDVEKKGLDSFVAEAVSALGKRALELGKDRFEAANLGYLPIVQVRGGAYDRRDRGAVPLENQILRANNPVETLGFASIAVPGDPQRRAYGIITPLVDGSRSLRPETFYGPALYAKNAVPSHQLFVGDTFVNDPEHSANVSALSLRFPEIARMLRSERSYVALRHVVDLD